MKKKKRKQVIVEVYTKLSRHHRRPTSKGGKDGMNIRLLPMDKHQAWHVLFNNMSPEEIVDEINEFYLDLDYEFYVHRVDKSLFK